MKDELKKHFIAKIKEQNEEVTIVSAYSLSKSEIVLPVYNSKKEIIAILDVDSDALASFDKIDEEWLKKIAELI